MSKEGRCRRRRGWELGKRDEAKKEEGKEGGVKR